MKNVKKVLLALVAISIVACGFSVFASATGSSSSTEILEFYESKIFINENFDAVTDSENVSVSDVFAGAAEEFVTGDFDRSSVNGGVLTVSNLGSVHSGVVFGNSSTGIGLNVTFAFDDSASNNGFAVALHTTDSFNSQTNSPLPLFIKNSNGVKIASGSGFDYTESIVESDFYSSVDGLENNSFYTVQVFCQVDGNTLHGTVAVIAENDTVLISRQFDISGYNPAAITTTFTAPAGHSNTISLDSLEIYEGSFARTLSGFDLAVGEMLIEISNSDDYEALSAANKVIVDYNYSTDNIADLDKVVEISNAIDTIILKLSESYAESFKIEVAKFSSDLDYVSRKNFADAAAVYASSLTNIRDNYPDQWATLDADESVTQALEIFGAEVAELTLIEEQTLAYINAVDSISSVPTATYVALSSAYDVLTTNEICPTYRAENYDEARVIAACEKGVAICEAYEAFVQKGNLFVENVAIAYYNLLGDYEDATFIAGYNAYVIAAANYVSDSTYTPDPEKYSDYETLLSEYTACVEYMSGVESVANSFLTAITDAEQSTSFTVKVSSINEASKYYYDLQIDYPGVAEAVQKYNDTVKYIADIRALAIDYIEAVLAIDDATTLEDRKSAIEYAKSLSGGADSSVDVTFRDYTVLQANIKLSAAASAIQYAETIVANFISAVDEINGINTVEARRSAIISALNFKAELDKVDEANNPNPAGVKSATTKLNSAIAQYNADITASNDSLKNAAEVAGATVCASVKIDAPVKKVVALIKKIYE